jgi:hypothetical protein
MLARQHEFLRTGANGVVGHGEPYGDDHRD